MLRYIFVIIINIIKVLSMVSTMEYILINTSSLLEFLHQAQPLLSAEADSGPAGAIF